MASLLQYLIVSLLLCSQLAIANPLGPPPTKAQHYIDLVDDDVSPNLLPKSGAEGGTQARFGSSPDRPPTKVQPRMIFADDDESPNFLSKRAGGHANWNCFGSFCPRPAPTRPQNYFTNGQTQEMGLPDPPPNPQTTPVAVSASDSAFYYDAWDDEGAVRLRIAPIQAPSPRVDFQIVARVTVNGETVSENFPRRDRRTVPQVIDSRTAAVIIELPADVISNARQAQQGRRTVRIVVEWSQEYDGH